jgi:DNA repair photolyase
MGKLIYSPKKRASEYAKYACNLFIGCSGCCHFCYNRKGRAANLLGSSKPTLKKTLINPKTAIEIFKKEANENLPQLRKHGIFFSFVSDPFLPETMDLYDEIIEWCFAYKIPVTTLTKQAGWAEKLGYVPIMLPGVKIAFGFTLTGADEMEPGCATNEDRISEMKLLHDAGYKTWASIEPIIDIGSSIEMIAWSQDYCDHYKIGILSGEKYNLSLLGGMVKFIDKEIQKPIYWKDSLLRLTKIDRSKLKNSVNSDFNIFQDNESI